MSASRGTFCISIGECITEAITARITMTLDKCDRSRRSRCPLRNSCQGMGLAKSAANALIGINPEVRGPQTDRAYRRWNGGSWDPNEEGCDGSLSHRPLWQR
jgi:hypothetical protein